MAPSRSSLFRGSISSAGSRSRACKWRSTSTRKWMAKRSSSISIALAMPARRRNRSSSSSMAVPGAVAAGASSPRLTAISRADTTAWPASATGTRRNRPSPLRSKTSQRALDYLKANAAGLRLDATRIVLLGRSAGGQIALTAAYARPDPALRGVISFYGPTDLVFGYDYPSSPWVIDSKKVLELYLRGSPAENPAGYAAASPVNAVALNSPPTLLIHGALDPMVWSVHSDRLDARLREIGRPHFYLRLPWATHGCDANLRGPKRPAQHLRGGSLSGLRVSRGRVGRRRAVSLSAIGS